MLYAYKHELTYRTARQILSVRERELDFYTRNIRNIGSQAALLAGFAFTTLVGHSSRDMLEWISEFAPNATFAMLYLHIYELSEVDLIMTAFELLYLLSTISAMGSTLYTLYICLITPILGHGLALRGNEGSVDRAVISLAGVNASVIREFGVALQLFQFSVLMKAFLTFHLIAACACACAVIFYYFSIRSSEKRIITTFSIPAHQIVTGRFDSGAAAVRWSSTRSKLSSSGASNGGSSALDTLMASVRAAPARLGGRASSAPVRRKMSINGMNSTDPYTQERRGRRRGKVRLDPDKEKPSNVARGMMVRLQGPLPATTSDADASPNEEGVFSLPKLRGM
ncbi:hypothetical protein KFE25_009064 [Diacronema lutheri]|uniref:Uncharacterized protein n=1 Tax=Diacronema lutheri TaxID=2081491 RepID=A0A8J5XM44_DIALT|nr:hypothetical protein KFE25_009064 [Diacronema lutheri]